MPHRLGVVFTWAAGGFSAVAAVLVFFGIKEGTLDQALRLNPTATLCIFILLGIGVVAALFAPALEPGSRLALWAVITSVILMLFAAWVFYPDFEGAAGAQDPISTAERPSHAGRRLVGFVALGVALAVAGGCAVRAYLARVRGWWYGSMIALATAVVLGVVLWPRGDGSDPESLRSAERHAFSTAVLGALLVAALLGWLVWAFLTHAVLPTVAGLVLIAVAATSLGLYGATKIAVASKMLAVNPQVTATVEDAEGGSNLVVTTKAGHLRGLGIALVVTGTPRAPASDSIVPQEEGVTTADRAEAPIWRALLRPDALDEIDETIKIPVVPTRWETLQVGYCTTAVDLGPVCSDAAARTAAIIRNRASELRIWQVAGHITRTDEATLHASYASSDVAPGVAVQIELCRLRAGPGAHRLASATLSPDANGDLTWEADLPRGDVASGLVLRHRVCQPGAPCASPWRTIASYAMAGSEPVAVRS